MHADDMAGLKPCPFCGDEAGPEIDGDEHAIMGAPVTIFCNGCHASAATEHTYAEAVRRWNTRVESPSTLVEEGDFVLVPREPTEAMLRSATHEGIDGAGVSSATGGWHGYYQRVWSAMLKAAEPAS